MELYIEQLTTLYRIAIAMVLCGIIGFEREQLGKPAGLRTNMIIGGASCLIVSITLPLIDHLEVANATEIVRTDPIRLLQALVVGISFIGAGTIIKGSGKKISGLTTAATLLFSMGVGIAVAIEQYIIAVGVTLIILFVNFIVRKLSFKFTNKDRTSRNGINEKE
ncbi:MgtC/SapB family protein [Cryomorpha ignava]|uniref:MgtC/SapB family protein n=1 Tax=Cryomorpha ignava TaxID=101383 RepID=A0A7K3WST7_9FLAO|nr:MgtC/SapB family protein [Cryomorpha ignava]NEN24760.1 MgtC/SapB family protein [Cryomorpha ignava]